MLTGLRSYESVLGFPLLPTFPTIFSHPAGASSVGLETSLSTSPSVAAWLRSLKRAVSMETTGAFAQEREEREALAQDLALAAEAYVEGWEEDDGDGSDDLL